jgi:hypothetical protein
LLVLAVMELQRAGITTKKTGPSPPDLIGRQIG